MRMPHALLALLAAGLPAAADESPRIERRSPELDALIAPDTPIDTLATGFDWAEGPVWDGAGDCLLFSDVPRNTIYRWPAAGGPGTAADPRNR